MYHVATICVKSYVCIVI